MGGLAVNVVIVTPKVYHSTEGDRAAWSLPA